MRSVSNKVCAECHRLRAALRRQNDPERDKRIKAASYQRHRTKVIAHVEAYVAANQEKVRARRRKYRQTNKEQIAERMKEWAKANRPLLRVHERRRRDRKRGATGSHTFADIQDIGRMQKWICAAPGCTRSITKNWHEDHIRPISKGGTDDRRNIQLLCPPCNQSKHARDPIEWAQSLGVLL